MASLQSPLLDVAQTVPSNAGLRRKLAIAGVSSLVLVAACVGIFAFVNSGNSDVNALNLQAVKMRTAISTHTEQNLELDSFGGWLGGRDLADLEFPSEIIAKDEPFPLAATAVEGWNWWLWSSWKVKDTECNVVFGWTYNQEASDFVPFSYLTPVASPTSSACAGLYSDYSFDSCGGRIYFDLVPIQPETCKSDLFCPFGFKCVESKCFPSAHPVGEVCSENRDCPRGFSCSENKCLPNPGWGAEGQKCVVSAHCPPGYSCSEQGTCAAASI